jgi:two-component system OmpR family response regulator
MARVLIVDDDRAGLEIRKLIFEHAGHRVIAAADPAAALAHCVGASLDTAFLDLRLPDAAAGLALIRDLRRAHPALRLVVLCGFAADLDGCPERALVDEVLSKPVRPERLLSAVTIRAS